MTNQVWQFSPFISVPIFTAGALSRSLDLAEIRRDSAIIAYESSIENAFRDVANALSAVETLEDRLTAQEKLVKATEKRLELSQLRYDAGIENYLAVLDSKRELYTAQQNFILLKAQDLTAKVTLYRSLGGGLPLQSDK